MKLSATLRNQVQASQFYEKAAHESKGWLVAGGGPLYASVKTLTRSLAQNDLLHALLDDIAKQCQYLGKKRSKDFWRGLFVSGWEIASGQKPEILPGLEGEFINIRQSTTSLKVAEMAGVIEYVQAWAAMNDVKFSAPKAWQGMEE